MQLWRINENDVSPVDFGTFESEKELQDLIERNPKILPIDADLMILAREFQCGAGVADFVAVDMRTGQLVIVETKLYRNGDRRRAVAQVLDYAADMFDRDLAYLECRVSDEAWAELDEATLDVLTDSLRRGDFRLVIVADQVDDRMRRVAQYFQSAGVRFQLELVTLALANVDSARVVLADLEDVTALPAAVRTLSVPSPRTPGSPARDHRDEMVTLLEQGLTQAEIARRLGLSPATVSRQLSAARGM